MFAVNAKRSSHLSRKLKDLIKIRLYFVLNAIKKWIVKYFILKNQDSSSDNNKSDLRLSLFSSMS